MSENNPMRDVIEQMKATAQREGKMQTSSVAKAAQRGARIVNAEIVSLLREAVDALSPDLVYDNDVSGYNECHFCNAQDRVARNGFVHDEDCLIARIDRKRAEILAVVGMLED